MSRKPRHAISEPEQAEAAATEKRTARDQELEDIRAILTLPQGRRFLWRLLEQGRLYVGTFTGDTTSFFNEGKRDLALWALREMIAADQGAYLRMQAENLEKITNG